MSSITRSENIVIHFHDDSSSPSDSPKQDIQNVFDKIIVEESSSSSFDTNLSSYPLFLNYQLNYTVKQLLLICEYYGIHKAKTTKKDNIIREIVAYETDNQNIENVCNRQNMWFYMNELKNDKYMKKFVLWP